MMKIMFVALLLPTSVSGRAMRSPGWNTIESPKRSVVSNAAGSAKSLQSAGTSTSPEALIKLTGEKSTIPKGWAALVADASKEFQDAARKSFANVELWTSNAVRYLHWTPNSTNVQDSSVMLRGHQTEVRESSNVQTLPNKTKAAAGTLVSSGGHHMTTQKGSAASFGVFESHLTVEVLVALTVYALIGANTASFVANVFQWPRIFSMILNVLIWPVLTLTALTILFFFRAVAKRQAKKYFCPPKSKPKTPEPPCVLLSVDEAWCAYHVAHAAHDTCGSKINLPGGKEVVTIESLRSECNISEKRALRWYKWLAGSAPELTVNAKLVKTAELHCADPAKICSTLFEIYHEDNHDTLSITDALNVLQGWGAGKYGASYIRSADMDYLINTLLAVLLSRCKCGSVNKSDWMKLADDYPVFFDSEPQYPQHVRYLRLMDRFRREHPQAATVKRGVQRATLHAPVV